MPVVIQPDSAKQTLYSMLSYGAERAGDDRPALAYYGNHISYGQLLADVHACAAGLRAHGVKRGDFVTIFLPNIPQCVVASMRSILSARSATWFTRCQPPVRLDMPLI